MCFTKHKETERLHGFEKKGFLKIKDMEKVSSSIKSLFFWENLSLWQFEFLTFDFPSPSHDNDAEKK